MRSVRMEADNTPLTHGRHPPLRPEARGLPASPPGHPSPLYTPLPWPWSLPPLLPQPLPLRLRRVAGGLTGTNDCAEWPASQLHGGTFLLRRVVGARSGCPDTPHTTL